MNKKEMILTFLKEGFDAKKLRKTAREFTVLLIEDYSYPDNYYWALDYRTKPIMRSPRKAIWVDIKLDKDVRDMKEIDTLRIIYEKFMEILAEEDRMKEYTIIKTWELKTTINARSKEEAEKIAKEQYEYCWPYDGDSTMNTNFKIKEM